MFSERISPQLSLNLSEPVEWMPAIFNVLFSITNTGEPEEPGRLGIV